MKTLPLPAMGAHMVASPRSLERTDSVDSACSSRSSTPGRATSSSGSNQSAHRDDQEETTGKPARKWVRKEKIGQGAQGCVYRCLEAATGREAACKVILLRDLSTMEVTAIKREVATIKKLKHPRLVRYWRATEVPRKRLSIYMEFVAGGALSGRLRREGALFMKLVKKFTRQLCEALAFLHARGIAHRDIKCANVFLTSSGEDADIKLGDFGAFKETGSASLVGGLKGTPHWMAPEVIRGVPPPAADGAGSNDGSDGESWWFRADVWSLGCATLEMLTGHAPWRQYSNPHTAMYQIVASNNTPTIPADASDETASFLQRCLQREPMNRATIAELLMHPFLSSGEEAVSTCGSSKSDGAVVAVDTSDDDGGRHGSADSESTVAGKTKKAARKIEPESSPTVKSEDEVSPSPRKPAEGTSHRSRGRSNTDGGNHANEWEANLELHQQQEKRDDDLHQRKRDASPERLRPSRIPRLKSLDPLKKKMPPACVVSPPTNNNHHDDSNRHVKQVGQLRKQTTGSEPSSSQLPRLPAVDKGSKKRAFAIPKHTLMPASSIALTGAAAPLKSVVVARRAMRAISPLPQRRVATAPALESSSSSISGASDMAVSPPGDGNGVARLKLPPLLAARSATASSCR